VIIRAAAFTTRCNCLLLSHRCTSKNGFTDNVAFATRTDIFVRVSGGETPPFRPPIPPDDAINDAQLLQLMRDCWDEYPSLRPDFSAVRSRFSHINKGKYDTWHNGAKT